MAEQLAPFDIRYDDGDRILAIRLRGFWQPSTVEAYRAELLATVQRLKSRGVRYDVLSDARDFPVQSKEIAVAFDRMMERHADFDTRRTAIIVSSQLSKMQAQRVMSAPDIRVFLGYDEARDWLLADRDAPA